MGVCISKSRSQGEVHRVLRRPAPPSQKVVESVEPPLRNAPSGDYLSVLDLMVSHQAKRVSIVGTTTDVPQTSFADKCIQREGKGDYSAMLVTGYACKKGIKPEYPNQDDLCIFRAGNTSIYGVFDGHGPYGHSVAHFVKKNLPRCFVLHSSFGDDPTHALTSAFLQTHQLCVSEAASSSAEFECFVSGSTATLVMVRDNYLYMGHVGLSRAVVGIQTDGGVFTAEDLTRDHTAEDPSEKERIEASGGQVRKLEGDIPHRVFLHGKMYPGLVMTRSIGDEVGASVGVISTPDVKVQHIQCGWQFLLICSDGVWEFMTSQEAVEIIGSFPSCQAQEAAEHLAAEAWKRWTKEEEGVADDITVICSWFHTPSLSQPQL